MTEENVNTTSLADGSPATQPPAETLSGDPLPVYPPVPPKGETWTKIYDCGCQASGGKGIPDYCSEHGTAPEVSPTGLPAIIESSGVKAE